MKKKSNLIPMFVMIPIVGLVISFLNGDFDVGSYFEGLEVTDLEVLLDYLNLGLGILALVSLLIFILYRFARKDKDPRLFSDWEEGIEKEE